MTSSSMTTMRHRRWRWRYTTISLAENTDISSALKVADITISDDGEGTNNLTLSGADKDLFFFVGRNCT